MFENVISEWFPPWFNVLLSRTWRDSNDTKFELKVH